MRVLLALFVALLVGGLRSEGVLAETIHPLIIETYINRLADPNLSSSQRDELLQRIRKGGVVAIPVLIRYLANNTPAALGVGSPPGECYNLPPHAPVPPQCQDPSTMGGGMQLKDWCEQLLYQILTPAYASPYARGADRGKAGMQRPFVVKDWPTWWPRYRQMDLAALHAKARQLIDQFWRGGWEKGPVEWK